MEEFIAWIFSKQDDLVINASTEMMGVFLSIPISVLFAMYLDRVSEKRRLKARARRLEFLFISQINYLTSGIFEGRVSENGMEAWQTRVRVIVYSRDTYDKIYQTLNSVTVDYSEYLNDKQVDAIEMLSALSHSTHACLMLRSGTMRELLSKNASREEIILTHVEWIIKNIQRIQDAIGKYQGSFKFLKKSNMADHDEVRLRENWYILFDQIIPDGDDLERDYP